MKKTTKSTPKKSTTIQPVVIKDDKITKRISSAVKRAVKNIPDFPKKGVLFRDFTPILSNNKLFQQVIDGLYHVGKKFKFDTVIAPESRGFWFAIPLALRAKASFIPCRKPGKLPRKTLSESYTLEYGKNTLEIHKEDLKKGSRVLIIDDVLATGGTIKAIYKLVKKANAIPVGIVTLAELSFFPGRKVIEEELKAPFYTFIKY